MSTSATALTDALDAAGVEYEVLPHDHTETAADEARALGIPTDGVAKTLVVETPQGNVRAVLPASERISTAKLAEVLDERRKSIQLAPEETLRSDYAEFEYGAVPPIGGARLAPLLGLPLHAALPGRGARPRAHWVAHAATALLAVLSRSG